jgi:hypothetical protein
MHILMSTYSSSCSCAQQCPYKTPCGCLPLWYQPLCTRFPSWRRWVFTAPKMLDLGTPAIEPACSILGIDQVRTYSIYGEVYDVFCSEGVRWVGWIDVCSQSWGDSQFFCDQNQLLLMDVQWLGWLSNQYFVTRLLMIPSLWERLHPIFPSTADQVFFHLSHRLLLPHNDIWARILREYWSYISGSRTRVGLQIRLHGRNDPGAFDEEVLERILQCLHSEKVGSNSFPF